MTPFIPYTEEESQLAHLEWKAACGHHSLAAAAQVPLNAIREAERVHHGWMNPRMMHNLCTALHLSLHHPVITGDPLDVLLNQHPTVILLQYVRADFRPGMSPRKLARHTHWIATHPDGLVLDTQIAPCQWIDVDVWLVRHDRLWRQRTQCTGWYPKSKLDILNSNPPTSHE